MDAACLVCREISGDIELVGANADRIPNTANVWVRGADAEAVIANVPQVMVSTGSACRSFAAPPTASGSRCRRRIAER